GSDVDHAVSAGHVNPARGPIALFEKRGNVRPTDLPTGCSCFLVMNLGRWTSCCRFPASNDGLGWHGRGELAAEADLVQKGTDGGVRIDTEGIDQGPARPVHGLDRINDCHVIGIRVTFKTVVLSDHHLVRAERLSAPQSS